MSLNNGSKTSKNDFYSKTPKNVETDFYSKSFQKKSSERGSPPQYEEAIQHLQPRKSSDFQFNKQHHQQIPTYSYSLNSHNNNNNGGGGNINYLQHPSSISLPSPPPYQSAPNRDFSKTENRFVKPVPLTSYGLIAQNRFTPSPAR